MNKRIIMLMAAALALLSASGQVEFSNYGKYPPIEITLSDTHSTLNKIFVLYDTVGVSMTYTSPGGGRAVWKWYNSSNWGYPTEITDVSWDGVATTKLDRVYANKGYIIEDASGPFYCWVVNYADYYLTLNGLYCESQSPCGQLSLRVDGSSHLIPYTNIDGRSLGLDRELELSYNTLEWDEATTSWQDCPVTVKFDNKPIDPPLCNTVFRLSGDIFLTNEKWGLDEVEIFSSFYNTKAVSCRTTAVQEMRDNNNEEGNDNEEGLGGSAPVHIVFTGYPTDAVVYRSWEISTDPEMENDVTSYPNQDVLDYTFDKFGTYYVRYTVNNAEGTCEYSNEIYTVNVAESELKDPPNVFSPGCTEGANDIWKVTYKSLVEFHCWIFNRWGNLVYEFTDPGGGWDGYYHGKLVDTGVYYYVLTATGSDGMKYKKRGDISILRYTRGGAAGDTGVEY